jgi:hypothetical protein
VIGDVTGKGARAAALTGLVRHTLRTAARHEPRPRRPQRGAGRRARRGRALLHRRGLPRLRAGRQRDAYGEEGLESLLRAAAGDDASTIAARIDRAAARAGARRDDVAVLFTRVRRAGSA